MAAPSSHFSMALPTTKTQEEEGRVRKHGKYNDFIATLPVEGGWGFPLLRKYQNFWYAEHRLPLYMAIQDTFKARPSDILLITQPKSGTTWLKALVFSIVNRKTYSPFDRQHPLLTSTPHDCLPFLQFFYRNPLLLPHINLDTLTPPRLLAVHTPYSSLPDSVAESGCQIVYLSRDPKDTLVSLWHFMNGLRPESVGPIPFAEAFELFCRGFSIFGPIWDHHLEYWRESLRQPEKVLFLKYEEVKVDTMGNVRRLAEFMGCPFAEEEEKGGVVEEIVRLCSFEKLSSFEANKIGSMGVPMMGTKYQGKEPIQVNNSSFFRKGEVGDWRNHMTLEMARRLDDITQEKLQGSGLNFCSG